MELGLGVGDARCWWPAFPSEMPSPWSRNWQEADSAIMAGQAERSFCVTELGQSRQWSELQCHKQFFFFNFLMWTILKIKSLLKSLTILLLFYVSIF